MLFKSLLRLKSSKCVNLFQNYKSLEYPFITFQNLSVKTVSVKMDKMVHGRQQERH